MTQTATLGPRAGIRTLSDSSIPWNRLRPDPPTAPGFYYLDYPGYPPEVVEICQHKGTLHIWSRSPTSTSTSPASPAPPAGPPASPTPPLPPSSRRPHHERLDLHHPRSHHRRHSPNW
jgi:hypothetical protein